MYVCMDVRVLFLEKPGLTPAYGLRRAKVGFGTDWGFFYVRLHRGDVGALFFINGK